MDCFVALLLAMTDNKRAPQLSQRRRDLAGGVHQGGDQRRHRVALRHHQPDAVIDHGIDDGNAAHLVGEAERFREFWPASRWPSVRS